MKSRISIQILVFGFLLTVSYACKKFVEINPGTNLVQTSDVFSSDQQALSAVAGVYASFRNSNFYMLNGGLSLYAGLAADEIYATAPTTTTDPFFQNQLLSSNSVVNNNFYSHVYKVIYQINAIIEGLQRSEQLSPSAKSQFTGEIKCMRAFLYFHLIQLFGDIPLVLSTDYATNSILGRKPIAEVYQQIIADLKDAKNLLTVSYPSAGKARPNKYVATAMLAKVYLLGRDWTNAVIQTSELINSGSYQLLTTSNLANVFSKGAAETVWEIANTSDISVPGDPAFFIPSTSSVKPTYSLTSNLLASFESGDARKVSWVTKNVVGGVDYWYPYKYRQKVVVTGGTPNEYQVVLRFAEQYLIRAEANAQLGNIAASQSDLNKIRNRAGLSNTNANTMDALLLAIEKENQIEFFSEQGHRWLNLLRTNRADVILGAIKINTWQITDKLWPIPENEINYNPFLYQNPG